VLREKHGLLLTQLDRVGAGLGGGPCAGLNVNIKEEVHHLICPRADIINTTLWSIHVTPSLKETLHLRVEDAKLQVTLS